MLLYFRKQWIPQIDENDKVEIYKWPQRQGCKICKEEKGLVGGGEREREKDKYTEKERQRAKERNRYLNFVCLCVYVYFKEVQDPRFLRRHRDEREGKEKNSGVVVGINEMKPK